MSAVASSTPEAYTYVGESRPVIPGATWADGVPGPAPNTPLPGLRKDRPAYIPLDVVRRRTREYLDDDDGWTKYESRRTIENRKKGYVKNQSQSKSSQVPRL